MPELDKIKHTYLY